jgi:hypothetical protein
VITDDYLHVFEPEQKQTANAEYAILNSSMKINTIKTVMRKVSVPEIVTIEWELKEVMLGVM